MKKVYILLSKNRTVFSRAMSMVVADEFTHAAISLDREMTQLFSFARRYEHIIIPAGLVHEDLDSGVYGRNPDAPCAVLELQVTDAAYAEIVRRIYSMMRYAGEYRFSILGVLLCKFDISMKRDGYYFCSQFVADVLTSSGALTLPKPPPLMHPVDFCRIPSLRMVYYGELKNCKIPAAIAV